MAAELPKDFEIEYMSLIADFSSDDTKKLRRNLVVSSFIILSVNFLDLSLNDVKAFGLDLSSTHDNKVYIIALIMMVFWFILFFINHVKDHEAFKEKNHNLNMPVYKIEEHLKIWKDKCEEDEKKGQRAAHANQVYQDTLNQYKIYQKQLARLERASKLQNVINLVNLALPALFGIVTIIILIIGLI
jgi:hypothetical protein